MKKALLYIILSCGAVIMIYPLLWLIGASFKSNDEIFTTAWFYPNSFDFSIYVSAWKTVTEHTMLYYFINTFKIIIPKVVFAVLSSVLTAYGFARFDFPLKRLLYALFMCTMFLPSIVTIMPLYSIWSRLGMLDTYIPLTVPALFAAEGSLVFMLIQFIRGIPKEFDEAARIDGCNAMQILIYILVPCIKPVIISVSVFTFLWTMNDFLTPLIMISSVEKYPLSLILRLSADSTGNGYEECKILAMSVLGLIPSVIVFGLAQKNFISGITTGGLSG